MGFTTSSLQVESVTPEKASEFLRCNYKHNRPPRQHHIDYLAREMQEGRFQSTAEVHMIYCNGEPVLVNGQHTCAAIIKYGKSVRITVRKSNTSEHGQIAMMYAFGHDTGLRRTFNDGVGAYNLEEQTGLYRDQVEAAATALRHIRLGFNKELGGHGQIKVSVAEIVDRLGSEWWTYFRQFYTVVNGVDKQLKSLASKRGALSVAVVTIRYQPEKALEFWRKVFDPDGLEWDHPCIVTRRVLEASKSLPGSQGITPQRLSRQLARCWRAYCDGELLRQLPKVADDSAPIRIVGTPYNGQQPPPPWWPGDERP